MDFLFQKWFENDTSNQESVTKDNTCPIPTFNELDFLIKDAEILIALNPLKKDKAPGLDKVLNEFLIAGKESLVKPFCTLFNLVFSSALTHRFGRSTFSNQYTL